MDVTCLRSFSSLEMAEMVRDQRLMSSRESSWAGLGRENEGIVRNRGRRHLD